MKIREMSGFLTRNKRPIEEWSGGRRELVETILMREGNTEVGIVPAEQGCVAIDVDMKHGNDGRTSLKTRFPSLPDTMSYKTSSGGWHVWYEVPEWVVIPQRNSYLEGVDIRHADGYVCFDKDYKVHRDGIIASAPAYLLEWLAKPRERKAAPTGEKGSGTSTQFNLSPIPEGRRNSTLFSWGFGIMKSVNKGELGVGDLTELIHLRGRISGLSHAECDKIVDSLLQYYVPSAIM